MLLNHNHFVLSGFELLAFDLLEIRNAGAFGRPGVAGPSTANASNSLGTLEV